MKSESVSGVEQISITLGYIPNISSKSPNFFNI